MYYQLSPLTMSSMNSSLSMSVGSSISSGDGDFCSTLPVTRVKVASWPPEEWTPKMVRNLLTHNINNCVVLHVLINTNIHAMLRLSSTKMEQ